MTLEELKKIAMCYAHDELKDNCSPIEAVVAGAFMSGIDYIQHNPGWISVEDEEPPKYDSYLTRSSGNVIEITHYNIDGWHTESKGKVTHWMPLPQAPKEGGQKL